MPKITVRKCPKTKKIFQSDTEYRKHILALRKRTNIDRSSLRIRRNTMAEVRDEIAKLTSIDQIEAYVTKEFSKILVAYNGGSAAAQAIYSKARIKDLEINVSFSEGCSNTHSAPRSGETNWGGKKDNTPRGYPGWRGSISYKLVNNPEDNPKLGNLCMRHNDALGFIGIHTGTGGGRGDDKWGYGVTLFLNDFEGLKKLYFKDKLAGHNYRW